MKRKYALTILLFGLTILVAILLQSFHSYHHIQQSLSEKHCDHHYAKNKTEIGHSHHDADHCFVCEFTLNTFSNLKFEDYLLVTPSFFKKATSFYTFKSFSFFSGYVYSLRGPPL